MKNTITFLITLLVSTIILAQNEFEPGIIRLKNGEEQKGLIQFFNKKDYNTILFKESKNSQVNSITSNQISYYLFDAIDKKVITETINFKPVFMEVIVEGKANLLLYNDENGNKRYFLKSEKSGLKELDVIIKNQGDLSKGQFKLKRYLGILNLEFNDCQIMKSNINNIKLTLTSLSKAFLAYNDCVENTTFKSERLSRKDSHIITIEAGLNATGIAEKGERVRGKGFSNSLTPTFGATYLYTPTLFNSKTSLSIGASYNQINSETAYFRNDEVLIGNYRITKINPKTINMKFGIHYNFNQSKRKINTSLGIFYINSRLLNVDSAYLRIDDVGNEEYLYEDFNVPIEKSSSGFAIELGIQYRILEHNDLTLKLAYERIGDFLDYVGATYASNTFSLKLGYNFKL
ncbi:hypothetical protein [Aquimarina rubra]|uniref:Outer membrane protein beta-barrel domain-containing protein n=1 Tax=Aquimarina rubra TaxID=1920033 RepID=A0ABW5LMD4_9FLAO